jgi:glutamyl-tRNA(Gln) amidotransferase subunit E
MYPETDVIPVILDDARWNATTGPELLTVRAERFTKENGLDPSMARQMAFSERLPLFERALQEGVKANLAARTLIATIKEIQRDGVAVENISDDTILAVLHAVETGRAAKEAVPDLLRSMASGSTVDDALTHLAPSVSREELESIIKKIITERAEFVAQKKKSALGPLMGVVMAEVRGSVDGKVVSEILKRELERALAKNP